MQIITIYKKVNFSIFYIKNKKCVKKVSFILKNNINKVRFLGDNE
jgi:hypothetical protein